MERIPFHRRPSAVLAFLLIVAGGLYFYLLGLTSEPYLRGGLFALIPLLGFAAAAYLFALSLHLLITLPASFGALVGRLLRTGTLFAILGLHALAYVTAEPIPDLQMLVVDLDLAFLSGLAMLALAAQFVLPVESWHDRWLVIRRLIGHLLGERGPVTFVHEGRAIEAYRENRRRGPGVFLVDPTSAVVFRTDAAFTRAAGPGVVFTRPGERLAEALDLRRQERRIQGRPPSGQEEVASAQSMAITRDGIPVSADLSVTFILDPGHEAEPREGRIPEKPPFEFYAPSVERAVYGHVFGELEDLPWTELPLRLLVELWREEIKRWDLSELLRSDPEARPLQLISDALLRRLVPPREPLEQGSQEPQEREILRSRGVRVLDVRIENLQLPEDIQHERDFHWRESWAGAVQEGLRKATSEVEEHRLEGELEAERYLAIELTSRLRENLLEGRRIGRREALALILSDAIRIYGHRELTPEAAQLARRLESMAEALARADGGFRPSGT